MHHVNVPGNVLRTAISGQICCCLDIFSKTSSIEFATDTQKIKQRFAGVEDFPGREPLGHELFITPGGYADHAQIVGILSGASVFRFIEKRNHPLASLSDTQRSQIKILDYVEVFFRRLRTQRYLRHLNLVYTSYNANNSIYLY